jgi:hypothetical protein
VEHGIGRHFAGEQQHSVAEAIVGPR